MLEEAYLYIDMPAPAFGVQLVYTDEREPELATIVREGDVVLMPQGYHPNVAAPGGSINFLWMMAAHRERDDRQFGVVNVHPDFASGGSGLDPGRATQPDSRWLADPFRLDGQVALVTGASRGLGAAMAIALADAGADVVAAREPRRRPRRPSARFARRSGDARTLTSSPTWPIATRRGSPGRRRRSRRSAASTSSSTTPASSAARPRPSFSDADWDAVIEVESHERCSACAARPARTCWRAGHGKIINIASLLSFQGGIRCRPTRPRKAASRS